MTNSNELIGEIAVRFAGAQPSELDRAITEVLATLGTTVNTERAYVTQIYSDGKIEVTHEWLDPSLPPHRGAVGLVDADTFAHSIALARDGEWLNIGDIDDFPPEAEAEKRSFAAFNVRSVLQIPAIVDGELVGVVGFSSHSASDWSTVDPDLVTWAAQAIGVALHRRRLVREIAAVTADAERARESARYLIGRFSHELRTPLHVILGYAELLQLNAVDPSDVDALAQIQFNGRRLLALIEDLMVFDDDPERGPRIIELVPVFDDVIAAIDEVAERRQFAIEVDIPDDATVWFDRGRLRQVLYCQLAATIQNSIPGTRVDYTTEVTDDSVELTMNVAGPLSEPLPEVAMPLAEALLEGEAVLDVHRHSPSHWSARFRLRRTPQTKSQGQ